MLSPGVNGGDELRGIGRSKTGREPFVPAEPAATQGVKPPRLGVSPPLLLLPLLPPRLWVRASSIRLSADSIPLVEFLTTVTSW